MTARKVIIDTDPGIDDAVAILLALRSPEFDVAGLTTLSGNIGIGRTTRNAGRILALARRPAIPVIAGAAAPLARKGFDTADIHGNDGLGGVAFPEPQAEALKGAVAWMAAFLAGQPQGSVDIFALGPLTNIAALVRDFPDAARRIGRVIAMGGAIEEPGNIGPKREFNIAADPEAADIVFRAGLNLTLIPLDVTRRVRATRETTALLDASSLPEAAASGALIDAYFQSTAGQSQAAESRPLHDPCVVLYALRPDLFELRDLPLSVNLDEGDDGGGIDVDPAHGARVATAMRVDGAAVLDLLTGRLLA